MTKKLMVFLGSLVVVVALASQPALAQSGAIGCGGGNGASIPCTGTVVQNSNGSFSSSSAIASTLTSVTGVPPGIEDLAVQTEDLSFSFSNVNNTFSQGGTFSLTDSIDSDFTVTGEAEFGTTPSLTGILILVLDPTFISIGGADDGGVLFSGSVSGLTGVANITLDPGTVTSMDGSLGLPSFTGSGPGPSPTPEPGTLLLLGSGLTALGFIRRKFARA